MEKVTEPGQIIRGGRARRSLTLDEVASRSLLSVQHLSAIERGAKVPSDEALSSIADVLELTDEERLLIYAGFGVLPPPYRQYVKDHVLEVVDLLEPFVDDA